MTGPARDVLLRRTTAASLAVHAALILVPAALLESLGGGFTPNPPAPEEGYVVSLYPVPETPASPVPQEAPEKQEVAEPQVEEVVPEQSVEPVKTAEPAPPEEQTEPEEQGPAAEQPAVSPAPTSQQGEGQKTPASSSKPGSGAPGNAARFQPPRLLAGALPIDPEDSREFEVPDEIPVRLRVGTTGKVLEIVPADPDLAEPVLAAIRRSAQAMRFSPARMGKKPVEAWFSMTFVYRK